VQPDLAGVLLGLEPDLASDLNLSYRVEIDGRRFEFAAGRTGLTAAHGAPVVTVTATAADLITLRLGPSAAERKAALRQVKFDGERGAIDAMRAAFMLSGDPGLLMA
jgi:hypothetical protein